MTKTCKPFRLKIKYPEYPEKGKVQPPLSMIGLCERVCIANIVEPFWQTTLYSARNAEQS